MKQDHITRALSNAIDAGRMHSLITIVGDVQEGLNVARWLVEQHVPEVTGQVHVMTRPDDWFVVFDHPDDTTVLCLADTEDVPAEVMARSQRFDLA